MDANPEQACVIMKRRYGQYVMSWKKRDKAWFRYLPEVDIVVAEVEPLMDGFTWTVYDNHHYERIGGVTETLVTAMERADTHLSELGTFQILVGGVPEQAIAESESHKMMKP